MFYTSRSRKKVKVRERLSVRVCTFGEEEEEEEESGVRDCFSFSFSQHEIGFGRRRVDSASSSAPSPSLQRSAAHHLRARRRWDGITLDVTGGDVSGSRHVESVQTVSPRHKEFDRRKKHHGGQTHALCRPEPVARCDEKAQEGKSSYSQADRRRPGRDHTTNHRHCMQQKTDAEESDHNEVNDWSPSHGID